MNTFSTNNKELFIEEINKRFNIDTSIIDSALTLNLLEYFFENKNFHFYQTYCNEYNIYSNTKIKNDYKNTIHYSVALFNSLNKLSLIHFEDEQTCIKYNKNILYIEIYKDDSCPSFIYISNRFFLKNFVNHPLNILSSNEKIALQTFVEEFFYNHSFFDDLFNNKKYFTIEYQINFNQNDSIENKLNILESYIIDANQKYNNIIKELKLNTDIFFERALLEPKMDNF